MQINDTATLGTTLPVFLLLETFNGLSTFCHELEALMSDTQEISTTQIICKRLFNTVTTDLSLQGRKLVFCEQPSALSENHPFTRELGI